MSINRRAAKKDANQDEIVAALRHIGASVIYVKQPVDLAVGFKGMTIFMEVKDGSKSPSRRKHTELQELFLKCWRGGPVVTVTDVDSAIRAVTMAGLAQF